MKANGASRRSWNGERLLSFSDLARQPNLPVVRSHWCYRRWATHGLDVIGRNNKVRKIKLASVSFGVARHTSIEALREFVERIYNGGE